MNIRIIPIFAGILLLFSACTDSVPEQVIDEETYIKMFIEFAVVNQMDKNLLNDNQTRDDLRAKVYEHYGVSKEEFMISHEFYENDLDKQLERLERINQAIRDERDKISEAEEEHRLQNLEAPDSIRQRFLNR